MLSIFLVIIFSPITVNLLPKAIVKSWTLRTICFVINSYFHFVGIIEKMIIALWSRSPVEPPMNSNYDYMIIFYRGIRRCFWIHWMVIPWGNYRQDSWEYYSIEYISWRVLSSLGCPRCNRMHFGHERCVYSRFQNVRSYLKIHLSFRNVGMECDKRIAFAVWDTFPASFQPVRCIPCILRKFSTI